MVKKSQSRGGKNQNPLSLLPHDVSFKGETGKSFVRRGGGKNLGAIELKEGSFVRNVNIFVLSALLWLRSLWSEIITQDKLPVPKMSSSPGKLEKFWTRCRRFPEAALAGARLRQRLFRFSFLFIYYYYYYFIFRKLLRIPFLPVSELSSFASSET